jgi:Kef-type K+ transport system membrane component KefB
VSETVIALILAIAIIIAASRLAGAIARYFGQPRVLGELIVGVLLGPTVIDLLSIDLLFHGAHLEETIKELAELGVIILMFIVGLEVHLGELAKVRNIAIFAGVIGALAPVALAVPVIMAFDYALAPAIFGGVVLAATSVSISAQVLLELGVLQTKEGNALLATALIDDVLAILLVSLAVATTGSSGSTSVIDLVVIVVRMAAYLVGATLLAWYILPVHMNWLSTRPETAQSFGIPAAALVFMLVFAWSAEELGGVAAITGAFIAGVGLSRTRDSVKREIARSSRYIAYAFLVPIFFVDVGLETDLSIFTLEAVPLATLLLLGALISKVGGCGLGARMGGFNKKESLRVGVCMISRGEVGLIIATLGLDSGVFEGDDPLFASLFLVILLTTVFTPPLVREVFKERGGKSAETSGQIHIGTGD